MSEPAGEANQRVPQGARAADPGGAGPAAAGYEKRPSPVKTGVPTELRGLQSLALHQGSRTGPTVQGATPARTSSQAQTLQATVQLTGSNVRVMKGERHDHAELPRERNQALRSRAGK
jgi:hypothetical protein